ncbi:hypothetical protein AB4Y44_00015 [Paraburkholderia sp. BR10937]
MAIATALTLPLPLRLPLAFSAAATHVLVVSFQTDLYVLFIPSPGEFRECRPRDTHGRHNPMRAAICRPFPSIKKINWPIKANDLRRTRHDSIISIAQKMLTGRSEPYAMTAATLWTRNHRENKRTLKAKGAMR